MGLFFKLFVDNYFLKPKSDKASKKRSIKDVARSMSRRVTQTVEDEPEAEGEGEDGASKKTELRRLLFVLHRSRRDGPWRAALQVEVRGFADSFRANFFLYSSWRSVRSAEGQGPCLHQPVAIVQNKSQYVQKRGGLNAQRGIRRAQNRELDPACPELGLRH